MGWLRNLIENRKEKWRKNATKIAKEEATRLFQIREYNHLLWLTYDGHFIAPFSMICNGENTNDCIALINTIRDLYIEMVVNGNKR